VGWVADPTAICLPLLVPWLTTGPVALTDLTAAHAAAFTGVVALNVEPSVEYVNVHPDG